MVVLLMLAALALAACEEITPEEDPELEQTPITTPVGEPTPEVTPGEPPEEDATPPVTPPTEDVALQVTPGMPEENQTPEQLTDEELLETGGEVYTRACAACHQEDGQGVPPVFPPMDGNPFVLAEDARAVVEVIITGRAGMPRFQDDLDDDEIAGVVSFVRTSWENTESVVSVDEVAGIREDVQSRRQPTGREPEGDE
jgi:mono/diheme cytochrome c family protein